MNAMTTDNEARAKGARTGAKRTERTCAGCGQHAAAEELVRVVHDPSSGEVAVDLAGGGFGRGAHFHPSVACVTKAVKSGLARVFKAPITADAKALADAIVVAADRRIEGLLGGANRARQLAVGSDVVVEAIREGRAELVVVARDAAAAAKLAEVERAIASGKAIAWSDKKVLGVITHRDEVAVVAILAPGVAAAVAQTHRASGPFRAAPSSTEPSSAAQPGNIEEAWSTSSEVR